MFKKLFIILVVLTTSVLSGCATVPLAPKAEDAACKTFTPPTNGDAGLYVFRNSFVGQALKKSISLDGKLLGETANKVYFYKQIKPGEHTLSTESEFSDNSLKFNADAGNNYFFEQYIKMGVFVGGANLKQVSEQEGKKQVLECQLAKSL